MTGLQIQAHRLERGMTQTAFWGKVGTSQTCGSRYEDGRPIPRPIKTLLDLVYFLPTTEAVEKLTETAFYCIYIIM